MVTIALNATVPTCTYSLLCLASAPRPAPSTCPWGWVFSLDWNDYFQILKFVINDVKDI